MNLKFVPEKLKEGRQARGLTAEELSARIGVSQQAVSQMENGKLIPSGIIIDKVSNILGFPTLFFMKKDNLDFSNHVIFFRSGSTASKKSKYIQTLKLKYLYEIYLFLNTYLDFPRVNIPQSYSKKGLSDEEIDEIAVSIRKDWGLGIGPISNLALLLEKQGVVLSRIQFDDLKVDALSDRILGRPLVLLGSDKFSAARSRFDLAHELGHLVLHSWVTPGMFANKEVFQRVEREANRFSSSFMLPKDSFGQEIYSSSLEHFVNLKSRWKMSIGTMIYRAVELGILSENQTLYLRKKMSKLNIVKKEPLDDTLEIEMPVALKQAFTMLIQEKIVSGQEIEDGIRLKLEEVEEYANLPRGILSVEDKVVPFNFKKR
jgi:Zn-dependent peptidase ImmA (M78 family)/transcriptional regulator with XRE-family HTH domain